MAVLAIAAVLIGGYFIFFPSKTQAPVVSSGFTSANVVVDNVAPNSQIISGMVVTGEAKGYYFEASFPVKLVDANGKVVLQTHAEAQSDWMTADFVPFKVTLIFDKPATATGKLILSKDNPSGLPQNDESVEIPIKF